MMKIFKILLIIGFCFSAVTAFAGEKQCKCPRMSNITFKKAAISQSSRMPNALICVDSNDNFYMKLKAEKIDAVKPTNEAHWSSKSIGGQFPALVCEGSREECAFTLKSDSGTPECNFCRWFEPGCLLPKN